MKLVRVEIEGYRSITKKIVLHFDRSVTVVLGANDHGKTNFLRALTHLNPDNPFSKEQDLTWDLADKPTEFPYVRFEMQLDPDEREAILKAECAFRAAQESAEAEPAAAAQPADAKPIPQPTSPDSTAPVPTTLKEAPPQLELKEIPETFSFVRRGVENPLQTEGFAGFDKASVAAIVTGARPRVEFIEPYNKISDNVTKEQLAARENEFMRGIFRYAGIDPNAADDLFAQNDITEKRLQRASKKLDEALRNTWSQGKDLSFLLRHNSGTSAIELKIDDISVSNQFVRASRRSSGFTHYFAMKTILFGRQQENPAGSYIWLFDEPGIYLHPSGQHDLLQVLEALGQTNQVVYVTHSLFMINKTFPARHRLLLKDKDGTRLDGKPYVSRWGTALNALGLSIAGTILFANHVLLTEGDSDPILIPAVLQKLISIGRIKVDLNSCSFISTTNSKNADAIARLLLETQLQPKLAALFDGDTGGKDRLDELNSLFGTRKIESKVLSASTTIEDHLPLVDALYVSAVARYVGKLLSTKPGPAPDLAKLKEGFEASFNRRFPQGKSIEGVAAWAASEARSLAGLKSDPSKVGIAREYVDLLADVADDKLQGESIHRAMELADWIKTALALPCISPPASKVLGGDGEESG